MIQPAWLWPGKPHAGRVDLRLRPQEAGRCDSIAREDVDRAFGRRLAGVGAAGLADTALVIGEDGDAAAHQQCVQVWQVRPLGRP